MALLDQRWILTHLASQVHQGLRERDPSCPLYLLPDGKGVNIRISVRGYLEASSLGDATGAGATGAAATMVCAIHKALGG